MVTNDYPFCKNRICVNGCKVQAKEINLHKIVLVFQMFAKILDVDLIICTLIGF